MKKNIVMLTSLLVIVGVIFMSSIAQAEPKDFPPGVKVGVVERPDSNTTVWFIRGPIKVHRVKIYSRNALANAELTRVSDTEVRFTQKRGSSWNIFWGDGTGNYYALVRVEDNDLPPEWMTPDVGVLPGSLGASLTDRNFMSKR